MSQVWCARFSISSTASAACCSLTRVSRAVFASVRSFDTSVSFSRWVETSAEGTAAVTDRGFLKEALREYGERIAVGVDIRDGCVSIKGWTQDSGLDAFDFCRDMEDLGVRTLIVTDSSKDGAMKGTNRTLYRELTSRFGLQITASGGVSDMEDVKALAETDLYGAIIGKAYYIGAIDLKEAVDLVQLPA